MGVSRDRYGICSVTECYRAVYVMQLAGVCGGAILQRLQRPWRGLEAEPALPLLHRWAENHSRALKASAAPHSGRDSLGIIHVQLPKDVDVEAALNTFQELQGTHYRLYGSPRNRFDLCLIGSQ